MKTIRVTRDFLRKPLNGVLILLSIVLLIEAVKWSLWSEQMLILVTEVGGFVQYAGGRLISRLLIPELFTVLVVMALVNRAHKWFRIDAIHNDWSAVARYELRFLPVFAFSFIAFNPITQTARYLLKDFPNYAFSTYWQERIVDTFTWNIYFSYLFPVILIGYLALNISLLRDFVQQRREAQEMAEAKVIEAEQVALKAAQAAQQQQKEREKALVTADAEKPAHLAHLRGKNATGELAFPVEDVHFFTVEDRYYHAELSKGRYLIGKTLNELEAELDATQFFRIKRDYIVNRHSVLDYAYWENGKYIVRINTPDRHEIVVPRARMQEFREWLQGTQRSASTDPSTGSLVFAN